MNIPLNIQILLGMFLGIFTGLFFGPDTAVLAPLGKAFVNLLKMTVVPFIACALIYGVGSLSKQEAKIMLKTSLAILCLMWFVVLAWLFTLGGSFPENLQAFHHSDLPLSEDTDFSLLELIIPANPFYAFANEVIPAIVLFCLLFGLSLIYLKNKDRLLSNLRIIIAALVKINFWVTRLSPFGIFAIAANGAGTMTFDHFEKIKLYLIAYLLGASLLGFVFFPLLTSWLTPLKRKEISKALMPALLLAFSTANPLVALPIFMTGVKNLIALRPSRYDMASSYRSIETLTPVLINFPTAGVLFNLLFVLFVSFFYAIPLDIFEKAKLALLGVLTCFGSMGVALKSLTFLIDKLQLPIDAMSLYLETMPLTRHFQAMLTISGLACAVLLIHYATRARLQWQKGSYKTVFLCLLLTGSSSYLINHLPMQRPHQTEMFSSLEIAEKAPEITTPLELPEGTVFKDSLERIKGSGVLRVGYNENPMPFAYRNNKGELVGYDIAFAHKLALDLGVKIEFIPFKYNTLAAQLANDEFDIAMSGISITERRLETLLFTQPYLELTRALIVKDYERHRFTSLQSIQKQHYTIAALKGSSFAQLAKELFPKSTLIPIQNLDEFIQNKDCEVLYWTQEEGTPWCLLHPEYTTVVPEPGMGKELYAYAVSGNSSKLQNYLNSWLELRKLDGFAQSQHKLWIRAEQPFSKPRWSILHNLINNED